MATMRVSFEEIGGISEFNGLPLYLCAAYVVNKAMDRICSTMWHGCDDENFVDYRQTYCDFVSRTVQFTIVLKG